MWKQNVKDNDPRRKFTPEQVREIRANAKEESGYQLAKRLGCHRQTIYNIWHGINYENVK